MYIFIHFFFECQRPREQGEGKDPDPVSHKIKPQSEVLDEN